MVDTEMYAADLQSVKDWGEQILSGKFTPETIFEHVNDLTPIFIRWAKTSNLTTLKQEAVRAVVEAKDRGIFNNFIFTEVCKALDAIHVQVNTVSDLDTQTMQAIQSLVRYSESGSKEYYDILKSYPQPVVERTLDVVYTVYRYFLSPAFTKSVYNKVALLGMNYAEFNTPADFTKANYLLQLLEKVGTIDSSTRLKLMDTLTTKAGSFSSALSEVLSETVDSEETKQ